MNNPGPRWFLLLLLLFILGVRLAYVTGFKAGEARTNLIRRNAIEPVLICDVPPPTDRMAMCDRIFSDVGDVLMSERESDDPVSPHRP